MVFWCYALILVVDCLNHIAKKPLGWKTSMEALNGDTADISPFRFKFWQPVKFMVNAQFPDSKWMMGRFVGIAWDTGDLFTFRVWSEPEGRWQDGSEYTRNVVRPRSEDEIPQDQSQDPDIDKFRLQRKVRTRKRRRGNKDAFELRDVPEVKQSPTNSSEDVMMEYNVDPTSNPVDSAKTGEESMDSGENETGTTSGKTLQHIQQPHPPHNKISSQTDTTTDPEELISEDPIEMIDEVNDHFSRPDEMDGIGGSFVKDIVGHDWKLGLLTFKVEWSDNSTSWESLKEMKEDYPRITDQYIVGNKVSRSNRGVDRVLQWAKKVVRDLDRAVRRITRLYDLYLDDHDEVKMIRRTQKNAKKKRVSKAPIYKYGIELPRDANHSKLLDEKNGNRLWGEANDK